MKKNLFLMTFSLSLLSLVLTAQVKTSAKTSTGVKTTSVAKKPTNTNSKYGTFKDPRDGHIYKTVRIGSQVWLAENLAYGQPSTIETPCTDYNVLYKSTRNIRDDGSFVYYSYDVYACGKFKYTLSIKGKGYIYESSDYSIEIPSISYEKRIMKFDRGYFLEKGRYTTDIKDAIAYHVKKYLDEQKVNATVPDICIYENNYNYGKTYGFLYTWEAAKAACPPGWHLPTKEEFEILINYLGGKKVAANKLKMTGNLYWKDKYVRKEANNVNSTNSSGFTALPGGYLSQEYHGDCKQGDFCSIGERGFFWSSSSDDERSYRKICLMIDLCDCWTSIFDNNSGESLSVRCVKD